MNFPASNPSRPRANHMYNETRRPAAQSGPRAHNGDSRRHMTDTYAWVIEQEFVKIDKSSRNTEQWIYEQRIRFPEGPVRRDIEERVRRRMWEDMVKQYEFEAEKWMRREEEQRRAAEERQRQKAKLAHEEMKRREAQFRQREAEKRKAEEERQRIQVGLREQKRLKAEKAIIDAWKRYEHAWSTLVTSSGPFAFSDIPWPVVSPPTKPEDITAVNLSAFLLSPSHSPTQTAKERIKSAQLRWHPDRFQRILAKVKESDKADVEEAAGLVSRYLNDLMRRH
ncbi:hypothetical protein K435DRAFT_349997 [Dendrothele bispora CBS 962.96]|uniref:J domain-containing protein n=1 Tax=Dendrothele bispora (strain CBS 962.96) TaxID=1314807 RepID=A0A4S8MJG7_DENBC|nr:hypothetical protein K435DRAFT_349997 [Dendrothele bispora CBS 962.96]